MAICELCVPTDQMTLCLNIIRTKIYIRLSVKVKSDVR